MQYYRLCLNSMPFVTAAYTYKTKHYKHRYEPKANFMELIFIEKGDIIRESDDPGTEKAVFRAPGFLVNLFDRPFVFRSETDHRHSTIAASVKYSILSVTPKSVADFGMAQQESCAFCVIPEYLKINEADTDLKKLFYKAVSAFSVQSSWRDLRCSGIFIDTLSMVLRRLERSDIEGKLEKLQPSSVLNCLRAVSYIYAHVDQRIKVEDLTSLLGISKGYLSKIFKSYIGYTLIEYINCIKLNKVASLITDSGLTLREAGEIVGFTDEHYLSRAFTQYLGTNARSFMNEKFKGGDTKFLEDKIWPVEK